MGKVRVKVDAIPQDTVAGLAFGFACHKRADVSREDAPRAEHADGAGGADYQEDSIVGVDEARPEAILVGA
jgi:hypothetical protein